MNVNGASVSANAATVQRDEEAVGVGVGEHFLVDVNPHLCSRLVSEDKKTSPTSGSENVTQKREVSFLDREGGENEGKAKG